MIATSETGSLGRLWLQKKFWANSDRDHVLAKWLDRERNGAEAGSIERRVTIPTSRGIYPSACPAKIILFIGAAHEGTVRWPRLPGAALRLRP